MTLDQLRESLNNLNLPGDTIIVLSKDSEGNDFSPLSETTRQLYAAESTWSGSIHQPHEWLTEAIAESDSEWSEEDRAPDTAVPSIVLWPTV